MSTATEVREPPTGGDVHERKLRPRWWREVVYVVAFYLIYSLIRNQFGSNTVSPQAAFDNAVWLIDLQRQLGLFIELEVQRAFLDHDWFIWLLNVFYGTLHFVATAAVMLYLYRSHPAHYVRWRTVLAWTTGLALIGFALFPLMPPRLMNAGGRWGWRSEEFDFVDTLVEFGGLWSFSSDGMQSISNQYAAMPSLHIGWALWCVLAMWAVVASRWKRWAMFLYPSATLFAIVVTGNHFVLDAVGGAIVLGAGYLAGLITVRRLYPWLAELRLRRGGIRRWRTLS
ncbi:MAG: phosphatase PAP2 family protein [Actinomycetota bacterium]